MNSDVKRWVLDYICCPECRGSFMLTEIEGTDTEIAEGLLTCNQCKRVYPISRTIANRLGINSLELSTDSVDVSVGTTLHIRFINYGAPTHATLRTEGAAYTNFTYENLYVEAESEIKIDILPTAAPGAFDVQVISGYGMRRVAFSVKVILPEPEPVAEPEPAPEETKKAKPLNGSAVKKALLTAILPIIGLIILLVWILALPTASVVLMAVILYVIMLAGIVAAWLLAQ
ncbi:MAG: Trm112 family protein [Methanocorpusculum sp.]|nr:Trm112 family protein [Methanocorpusculum sp.]